MELEKEKKLSKFENNSKILDDIINNKKSSNDKIGLGYDQKNSNKGSNSTSQEVDKNSKKYATAIQSFFNQK